MNAATTTRPARAAPIGTGHLHSTLEDARDRTRLQAFCAAVDCAPTTVSVDGVHADWPRVFDLMRQRGYTVTEPTRPQTQMRKDVTTWLTTITLPNGGPSCVLGFCTPNTS